MERPAATTFPVSRWIGQRYSAHAFDSRAVEVAKLQSCLEAARWAPSSYNEQPWAFILALRQEPAEFEKMLGCLLEGNVAWAKNAPILMLSVAKLRFEHNAKENRHAFHDVGLATGNLIAQASDLGLSVHAMAGFLPDKARQVFAIPATHEPVAAIAMGYASDPSGLPEPLRQRATAPRARKPLESFIYEGRWGNPAAALRAQ